MRWVENFVSRHGKASWAVVGDTLVFTADDGATALFEPPFPPLPSDWAASDPLEALAAHARAPRTLGVLLVRLGGYAAGVFVGDELATWKAGSRPVHGRAAAGGWSQQRFARRREGQARVALGAAADAAVGVLLPRASDLSAVVTGGDRSALRQVLDDVRLRPLQRCVVARVLDVPDPKLRVLRESLAACRAVRVTVTEPSE